MNESAGRAKSKKTRPGNPYPHGAKSAAADVEPAIKAEAKTASGAWIEERYNRKRRHSSIGMLTPVRFEEHQLQTAQAD